MKERRNFYRSLYAQPDAPLTVIQVNYRILMLKLRMHPDHDYVELQAGYLKAAMTILNDPLKRAIYDRQLQKRYSIRVLSLGSFASGIVKSVSDCAMTQTNRRNYYRVLQIQPDAPAEIITGSYQALLHYPFQNIDLLGEAYTVLANPAARLRYDAYLAGKWEYSEKSLMPVDQVKHPGYPNDALDVVPTAVDGARMALSHCIFCHAAYAKQTGPYQQHACLECGSPLPESTETSFEQKHRTNIRIHMRGKFEYYLFWPDTPSEGILQDLSPRGTRFFAETTLDLHEVIKIDAPNFRAVAKVIHLHQIQPFVSVGARFLTVKFEQERGGFLAVHV
ncbi:molecular chaperone DnaJ [Nitrosomonas sp.]|uniref:molecular chaperone DnaJ n=1 Tax=Nitrosomonas sp. TaxID=42353 RepID=UPI001DA8C0F7|nr:molecular chaperone DnaJ [Nitrosomonas sp.]MCB1949758.1 molecular chaperone DnaJ [Nitrosomonas sp.]